MSSTQRGLGEKKHPSRRKKGQGFTISKARMKARNTPHGPE